FEATELIRQQEQETGRRVPIIALTAHAMKGDRERCLAAGMDAYVAKPIRERELVQAVQHVLRPGALEVERPPAPAKEKEEAVMSEEFDPVAALERCGNDPQLLRELIDIFLAQIPGWMSDLGQAVQGRETIGIKRLAHMIKGGVGTFGAQPAHDAAMRLETMGREGNLDGADEAWEERQQA